MHSGTIRYYAGRDTIRTDVLDPRWLDRAVAWLAGQGRHPYILVEDWEKPLFVARFAGSTAGRLETAPVLAWQSVHQPGSVWLYDPLASAPSTVTPDPAIERTQPLVAPPARSMWPK
jgi:hypothetical protein